MKRKKCSKHKRSKIAKALSLFVAMSLACPLTVPVSAATETPVEEQDAEALDLDFIPTEDDTEVNNEVVDVPVEEVEKAEVAEAGTVSAFSIPEEYLAAYNKAFSVSASSVDSPGGKYGSSHPKYAIDGDVKTHWETGKANNGNFKNALTFSFDKTESLGSIVYYPRVQGAANKGFPTSFSIYASQAASGDDFKLVMKGKADVAAGGTQMAFQETKFRRLKFVFETCKENWAACGEMKFYRTDSLPAEVETLFSDGTWSALAPGLSPKDIDALSKAMADHPLRPLYADALELAVRLAEGETAEGYTVYDIPGRGPYQDDIGRAATWNQMFPYQPTGYYAVPGTTLDVYVEPGFGDSGTGSLPQLVLGQIARDKNGWGRRFNLKEGHNIIQVPNKNNMNPGAIYFVNRNYGYTGITPDVRFADASGGDGVRRFPLYYQDSSTEGSRYLADRRDEASFLSELEEYITTLSATDAEAAVGTGNYNLCELGSENVLVSTSATGAEKGLQNTGLDKRTGENKSGPSDLMNLHEENYANMMTYAGYEPERLGQSAAPDKSDPLYRHYRPIGRFMIRVFCQGPFGWGDAGYIGFNGGFSENNKRGGDMFSAVASCSQITGAGWALAHELGHLLEGSQVGRAEYTNNLFSLQFQNEFLVSNRVSARFREQILNYNNQGYLQEKRPGYINDNFVLLGILYQLEAVYGDHGNAFSPNSVYARTLRWSRDNGTKLKGLENGDTLSMNRFAVAASNALGIDLTNHFEHYGIEITAAARKSLDPDLQPNTKKTWLATSAADAADVQTLDPEQAPVVTLDRKDGEARLTMDLPEQPAGAAQMYEIMRDGKLAGYALASNASNIPGKPNNLVSWTDKKSADGEDHIYTVYAYDARLNVSAESAEVTFQANEPYIEFEGSRLLTIHEEFDPLSAVTAHAANGEDLTSEIRIESSDLNVDNRGTYNVTYTVTDTDGNRTSLTTDFTVVSSFTPASDVTEASAKVGYGSLTKDKSLKGGKITLLKDSSRVTFDKGLAAHASSELIYDLTDKNFGWFESYVGIDQSMKGTVGKAKFQVYVDGELRYDSGTMVPETSMGYVAVDLTDAQELRLVTDSLGANSNDHTVWAGARFSTDNDIPVITADDLAFTDPSQVDLNALPATAYDSEDGDLTGAITYTTDYVPGKTGPFTVTYSVTDSDGNTVELIRSLAVVNSSVYISDHDWKSAKVGYGSIKKDRSLSGNPIKITTEEGVTTYEKGIGVHAYSEVVYDIEGTGFYYFESLAGVDATASNNRSSVVFQIFVDGQLMAETPVMRKGMPAEYFCIPLAGAKTLKLVVTDGGNGNGNDHANWVDAKFLTAVTEAEKATLADAVAEGKTKEESMYTAESWTIFHDTLTEAEEILNRPDASQEEVDAAANRLVQAMDELVKLLDTKELDELLSLARSVAYEENSIPENKHPEIVAANLTAVSDDAEAALQNPDITQEEIDSWAAKVRYFIWDLNPIYVPGYSPIPVPEQN